MRRNRRRGLLLALPFAVLAGGALIAAPRVNRQQQERFPHAKHANLFPLCTTCHTGVVEPGQPLWPGPASCASCHDGVVSSGSRGNRRHAPAEAICDLLTRRTIARLQRVTPRTAR